MKLCNFDIGLDQPLFLIAGPCVVESEQLQMDVAGQLKEMTGKLGIPFIFKSSYDKANRSSGDSFRGPGMIAGLAGMLYIPIGSFVSPTNIGVGFSTAVLVWLAVGGRGNLTGAMIGAFANEANVKTLKTKLSEQGIKTFSEPLDTPQGKKTRVRAGPFPSREAAEKALEKMQRIGVSGVVAAKP